MYKQLWPSNIPNTNKYLKRCIHPQRTTFSPTWCRLSSPHVWLRPVNKLFSEQNLRPGKAAFNLSDDCALLVPVGLPRTRTVGLPRTRTKLCRVSISTLSGHNALLQSCSEFFLNSAFKKGLSFFPSSCKESNFNFTPSG